MPWPKGVPTTWNERLRDDDPCPSGDVGQFRRYVNGKRQCLACARRRVKVKRVAKILAELRAS